jgi:hypothetical protein
MYGVGVGALCVGPCMGWVWVHCVWACVRCGGEGMTALCVGHAGEEACQICAA